MGNREAASRNISWCDMMRVMISRHRAREIGSRAPDEVHGDHRTGRVLVGFDGSPAGEHALAYANGLALRTGAQLLVATIEHPPVLGPAMAAIGCPVDPYVVYP